ncbi:MAG: hypothetical protein GY847_27725 [Proteobacteria bacterium]|nr:hypothetical protein [Pseudomonadota bacterium]
MNERRSEISLNRSIQPTLCIDRGHRIGHSGAPVEEGRKTMKEKTCYLLPREAAIILEVYLKKCQDRGVPRNKALARVIREGVNSAQSQDELDEMARSSTEEMDKLLASMDDLEIEMPDLECLDFGDLA